MVASKKQSRSRRKSHAHNHNEVYPGFPHGMPTTHADQIHADLLAFLKQS